MTGNQYETAFQYEQYSADSEQSVIGAIFIKPEVLVDVLEIVSSEDFFLFENKMIFRAFEALDDARKPIDPLIVADYMKAGGLLDDIGGLPYLTEIAHNTPSAANVKAYARQVKDKAREREVIGISIAMQESVKAPEGDTETRLNNALALPLTVTTDDKGEKTKDDHLKDAIKDLERRHLADGRLTGLSTGFRDIDRRYNGLHPGQLVIIAARPSMGKTTLVLNMAQSMIFNGEPGPVPFFSLEMPGKALMEKMICAVGGVDYGLYKKGLPQSISASADEWPKVMSASARLKGATDLVVDDRSGLTFQQIRSKCIRLKRKYGSVKCIMVDYLTLVRTPGKNNRNEEVGALSRGFKNLAKEIGCPVVLLAQLSRKVEERKDKRPMMSDLRDSGEIEQDADIITFIYRDEIYNEDTIQRGIAEMLTVKHREGEPGRDFLASDLRYSRFRDMPENFVAPEPEKKKEFY